LVFLDHADIAKDCVGDTVQKISWAVFFVTAGRG
jgi:hypothetical protein